MKKEFDDELLSDLGITRAQLGLPERRFLGEPWKAEGVSRATWYRRQKAAGLPTFRERENARR
jgi:hypothetical protein